MNDDSPSAGFASEPLRIEDEEVSHISDNATRSRLSVPSAARLMDMKSAVQIMERYRSIRGIQRGMSPLETMLVEIRILTKILSPVISYTNGMGGASKSTTALYHGNILADTVRRPVFLLPATAMAEMASGGMYAGIQPEDNPLDILRFAELIERYTSYWTISPDVPVTPHGLHVISEPYDPVVDMEFVFQTADYLLAFDAVRKAAAAVIADHGNDGIRKGSIVLETVHRSHVVVFTATADNMKTLQKLTQIMRTYANDSTEPAQTDSSMVLDPSQISTRNKVLAAPVVISKTRKGQTAEDFREYLNVPEHNGPVIVIPHDRYIEGNVISRLGELQRKTYEVYVSSLLDTLRVAADLAGVDRSMMFAPVEAF